MFCAAIATAYAWIAPPSFSAKTQILIESRLPQALREQLGEAGAALDSPAIESQIALLRSGKIMSDVIEKLKLEGDVEFGKRPVQVGFFASVTKWWKKTAVEPESTAESQRDITIANLQSHTDISRYGLSYVLDVSVNSRDAEKAAKLSNEIAEAFMADQLHLKIDAARQASDWREEQIGRLRQQMNKSARAVQEYKARRDYRLPPRVGETPASDGVSFAKNPENAKDAGTQQREAVTLEELEVSAQAYRKIYELNLQAHADAVLRQTLQFTNARVISAATAPRAPTHPRKRLLLLVGSLTGAVLGLILSILHYTFDTSVRTKADIERAEDVPVVGDIAPIDRKALLTRLGFLDRNGASSETQRTSALSFTPEIAKSMFGVTLTDTLIAMRRMQRDHNIVSIGITGIGSSKSRSLITGCLAAAAAKTGQRSLLIDCDTSPSGLSQELVPVAVRGLCDVISGGAALTEMIRTSETHAAHFLPIGTRDTGEPTLTASQAKNIAEVVKDASAMYDVIYVDLPNMNDNHSDAVELLVAVDAVLCVVESGMTTSKLMSTTLQRFRRKGVEPAGIILYGANSAVA